MTVSRLDSPTINHPSQLSAGASREEIQARRAATEFEALLLSQLTKSLNPSPNDEEGGLFNSNAMGMYGQMFSEQVAETMAKNGGIGLADLMMRQIEPKTGATNAGSPVIKNAIETARLVRTKEQTASSATVNSASGSSPSAASQAREAATATRLRRVAAAPAVTNKFEEPGHLTSIRSTEPVILQMPVRGRISSPFGGRRDPFSGRHGNHLGVDIAVPRGTPIGAAAAGQVVFAGRQSGYGNTVVIEHADGRRTRYAHAERLFVSAGEAVQAGQTIAAVGSTGRSTGPHLHFEVTENGRHVDPLRAVANGITLSRR